eukprot:g904.t1
MLGPVSGAIEAKCSPEVRRAFRALPLERCGCATIQAVWAACDTFWEFDAAHTGAITREDLGGDGHLLPLRSLKRFHWLHQSDARLCKRQHLAHAAEGQVRAPIPSQRCASDARGLSPDDLAEGDPGGRAARAAWIFGDGRCWGDAGALQ